MFEVVTTVQEMDVIDHKATGAKAAAARQALGLSMQDVAAELGKLTRTGRCSRSYVCDLEHGHRNWDAPMGKAYAAFLNRRGA